MISRILIFHLVLIGILPLAGCADTDAPMVVRHKAMLAQQNNNWERSIEIRKKLLANLPENYYQTEIADIHFEQAEAYLQLNKTDQALKELDAAIESDPPFREAFALRSDVHYRLGNIEQAMDDSTTAITLRTDDDIDMGELYLKRGDLLQKMNHPEAAIENWVISSRITPQSIAPYLKMAQSYSQSGKLDQALYSLDQALDRDNANPQVHLQYSKLFVKMNRLEDAKNALKAARELDVEDELKLPESIEKLKVTRLQKDDSDGQYHEQITAKPILTSETSAFLENEQAFAVARKYLLSQNIECLEQPANLENAILCKENQLEFQVLVKSIQAEKSQVFELTKKEHASVVSQSIPVGMIVITGVKFDPQTATINKNSGHVFAFAKHWKPMLSQMKPTGFIYDIPYKP